MCLPDTPGGVFRTYVNNMLTINVHYFVMFNKNEHMDKNEQKWVVDMCRGVFDNK